MTAARLSFSFELRGLTSRHFCTKLAFKFIGGKQLSARCVLVVASLFKREVIVGTILNGDQYGLLSDGASALAKKAMEMQRQLGQPNGYPFDHYRLRAVLEALNAELGLAVHGRFKEMGILLPPSMVHVPELVPQGHTIARIDGVLQDVPPSDFVFHEFEFLTPLCRGETAVSGEIMRSRAKRQNGNLGLSDVPRLLRQISEIQESMPDKLQGVEGIILPGTLLRSAHQRFFVPVIRRKTDGVWSLKFVQLEGGWRGVFLLACRT